MEKLSTWAEKAKYAGALSEVIDAILHPLSYSNDETAELSIVIQERGERITRLYGDLSYVDQSGRAHYKDENVCYTAAMCNLDKEARICIADALTKRVEDLKTEMEKL